MRTDSVTLAEEALAELRDFVTERYGADEVPDEPRRFKTKAKNAQEAHEAIRPTSAHRIPDEIKDHLSRDQLRLYELDLETHGRLPDDPRHHQHGGGGPGGGRRGHVPGHRLDHRQARASWRSTWRDATTTPTTTTKRCCRV